MPELECRILVADDQRDVREALRLLLKAEGFKTETVESPAEALHALKSSEFDLVIMDLNYQRDTTSGREGIELLGQINLMDNRLPVVVMTAWGSVELAVEAMRNGARDFVQKPWDNNRLLAIVRNQVALGRALRQTDRLEAVARLAQEEDRPCLIAESPAMRPVLEIIARVGRSDAAILITGENGTGKGLVAQAVHAASDRSTQPFVAVNMGGLSEGVFESELFGHVKGAFTDAKSDRVGRFELADGGSLFLDEIGNLTMNQQTRLLKVVETGEFEPVGSSRTRRARVRLISATNADLKAEVATGKFRQDLLFRLNTVEIRLPPLRERLEDILPLASFFLAQHLQRYRKQLKGFDPNAVRLLQKYPWPGNVRELNHAVERAVLMADGEQVRPADLGLAGAHENPASLEEMSLDEVERHLIKRTLMRYDGNARQAAEALGLSRSAFYRRLEKYGF